MSLPALSARPSLFPVPEEVEQDILSRLSPQDLALRVARVSRGARIAVASISRVDRSFAQCLEEAGSSQGNIYLEHNSKQVLGKLREPLLVRRVVFFLEQIPSPSRVHGESLRNSVEAFRKAFAPAHGCQLITLARSKTAQASIWSRLGKGPCEFKSNAQLALRWHLSSLEEWLAHEDDLSELTPEVHACFWNNMQGLLRVACAEPGIEARAWLLSRLFRAANKAEKTVQAWVDTQCQNRLLQQQLDAGVEGLLKKLLPQLEQEPVKQQWEVLDEALQLPCPGSAMHAALMNRAGKILTNTKDEEFDEVWLWFGEVFVQSLTTEEETPVESALLNRIAALPNDDQVATLSQFVDLAEASERTELGERIQARLDALF